MYHGYQGNNHDHEPKNFQTNVRSDQIDLSVEIPTITCNQATKAKQSTQNQKAKAILQIGAEVRITLLQSPVVVIPKIGQGKDFQDTPQAPTMPGSGLIYRIIGGHE